METVDLLFQLPHIDWCGIYFYNDVTREFYLGYYRDQPVETGLLRLDQLSLRPPQNKLDLCNNVKSEGKTSPYNQTASEIKVIFKKPLKIFGLFTLSSKQVNVFDNIDEKYLLEIAETLAERIQY
jgi:putative methionine-R-sulfoxide reductase with GAF domain